MFRYTKLSSEHVTICFDFESADGFVGATSYGHQNWTSDVEERGGGIHRQYHNFSVVTRRHLNFRGLPDLRKATGAFMNIRKNESYDGRIGTQISEHAAHTTLSGNNHTVFQIYH
jgi:hypothetical protein